VGGISDWKQVDIHDIGDIVIPETTLGLSTWWMDLESNQVVFPCLPAEIESALLPSTAKQGKVCLKPSLTAILLLLIFHILQRKTFGPQSWIPLKNIAFWLKSRS